MNITQDMELWHLVANASIVAGLNCAPSELPGSGSVVRMRPSFALMTTMVGCAGCPCAGVMDDCPQATKSTSFFTSSASPLHRPPLAAKS